MPPFQFYKITYEEKLLFFENNTLSPLKSFNAIWLLLALFVCSFANAANYYSKSTGTLNTTTTWGTNTDGSGTAPANFTTGGNIFYIRNNTAPTVGANWTVSGAGSKIVLGDGVTAINFTVGNFYNFTATMDILASGTLILSTTGTTAITFGTLAITSTVNYAENGAQSVLAGTYGNLILSGSGNKTFPSNITIGTNLTITGTAKALLTNGTTATATTLTLGGVNRTGSWGSSGSSAPLANRNDTYFVAANSGIVNVSCAKNVWLGTTSTDWNTASNWCSGVPLATTNVVIPAGVTNMPTIAAGTTALCNDLIINASATLKLAASGTSLLNISGDFVNSGTFTAGSGSTVNFVGASQSVAGVTYSNFTISGSGQKILSGAITVGGNLFISSGTTLIDNDNQITGNATGTLTVQNGGTLFLGRSATDLDALTTQFPTAFTKAHISLLTGSVVQYNSSQAQIISYVPDYYTIECQFPGTKSTVGAGMLTVLGSFGTASPTDLSSCTTVNLSSDFNLWGAGAPVTLPNGTLNIGGDFNRDVANAGGTITPGTGTVNFNGTSAQSITGKGVVAISFNNLIINNTLGGVGVAISDSLGANDDVTVTNTLTMSNGILTTSATNLLNITNSAIGAITGGSVTSFINGPVKWTTPLNSTYTFPVGKGITYLPFVLKTNRTTATPSQVEAFNSGSGGTPNFTIPTVTATVGSLSTTEYWSLDTTTGNFTTSVVSLSRPTTAITPLDLIAGSATVAGTYTSLSGTVGTNGITTSTAIGTNRFFVLGRKNGIRINGSITGSPFCAGSSVSVPFKVTWPYTGTNVFNAQLSDAFGSFASPVDIGNVPLQLTGVTNPQSSGTISATIPAGITTGTGYRIRVVSSVPNVIGEDNGTNLTINALPSAPIVGAITYPTCSAGSVVLSGLPASGTIYQTTGTVVTNFPITGTTMIVSGLAVGTYDFSASNGTCTSSSSSSVVIDALTTTTYTDSGWSTTPNNLNMIGIINSNTPITSDVVLCNCTVNTGINANIATGVTLKLQDKLTVNGTAKLIFENNASLVQINDNTANSGEITYKRKIPTIRKTDYVYWSSPVSNFTLGGIQTGTLYYSFDGVANDYVKAYPTTVMDKGKGYIVRGAGTGFDDGTIDITTSFKGIPNNGGNFIVPVTGAGTTNLIGNPYPSALSADAFLAANNKILEGTLYFWTHNTSIRLKGELNPDTAGSGAYAYTSDDYAAYNFTGGIATTGKGEESISKASTIPNGFIASGVAFFAEGIASGGNLIFKNEMRLSSVVTGSTILDNSQVFRTAVSGTKKAKIAPANSIEKNRVWLNLTNAQGAFKQILVGYVTGATNDYDNGYDGESFDGNDFIDFYSINHNKNLTIQGRALPFDATDSVPLGYSSTIEGGFSISIEEVDGTMQSQSVFLEDRVLNVVQDLKVSPYTFNTAAGTFHDRFVLRYTDRTLGNVDFDKTNNQVSISKDKNDLKVKSEIETIKQITVFDLLGKKVFEKEAVNSNEFSSSAFGLSKQVGIVKVTLANGQVISKKVVF